VLMLIGTSEPDLLMRVTRGCNSGFPDARLLSRGHSFSQMSARKISKHFWPTASAVRKPVIVSAAGLKYVIVFSRSMVRTPSPMLSMIVQQCEEGREAKLQYVGDFSLFDFGLRWPALCNGFIKSSIFSLGAITGLKDRYSMGLKRFSDPLRQVLFYKFQRLRRVILQVDVENLRYIRNTQINHHALKIH